MNISTAAERAKRAELQDTNSEPFKEASREARAAERAKRAELQDTNSEPLKEDFLNEFRKSLEDVLLCHKHSFKNLSLLGSFTGIIW